MIPAPRWRDLAVEAVGALLAFFAQPIALIALVGLVCFTAGRCSGRTDATVARWVEARDLHVGPLWEAFHGAQSADSVTAARLTAWVVEKNATEDSLRQRLAVLSRPPRPTTPSAPAGLDSAAYAQGYGEGYDAGWTEAADTAAAVYEPTLAIVRQQRDSAMAAAAVLERARRAAVAEADTLRGLLRVAPVQRRRLRLSCGPGVSVTRHGVDPSISCHLSR